MSEKIKKLTFFTILIGVSLYFILQELKLGLSAFFSAPALGAMSGTLLGHLAGALLAVYIYLFIKRILLKAEFPKKIELWGFILYTIIIISAVWNIPK